MDQHFCQRVVAETTLLNWRIAFSLAKTSRHLLIYYSLIWGTWSWKILCLSNSYLKMSLIFRGVSHLRRQRHCSLHPGNQRGLFEHRTLESPHWTLLEEILSCGQRRSCLQAHAQSLSPIPNVTKMRRLYTRIQKQFECVISSSMATTYTDLAHWSLFVPAHQFCFSAHLES